MPDSVFRDALRFWETRRIAYNLVLGALAVLWVTGTWPHFAPAMTLPNAGRVLILAALANLCYSAAYIVDIPLQQSELQALWRRSRWIVWLGGTLFALAFAHYWIGDEIYPGVNTP